MTRTFEDSPAVREAVPLLLGLVGPSGSGKTFSALRLATGMQKVTGGEIFLIDTEARRAVAYADYFRFRHVPFEAPFSSKDTLAAIKHCVDRGAKIVIVDSMSSEWEEEGGVLDAQDAAFEKMGRRDSMKYASWVSPKREHKKVLLYARQQQAHILFCYRAEDKMEAPKKGQKASSVWAPVGEKRDRFFMQVTFLLLPGAMGVPTWRSDEPLEQQLVRLPEWARTMFKNGVALDEDTGQRMAAWAAGPTTESSDGAKAAPTPTPEPAADTPVPEPLQKLLDAYEVVSDPVRFDDLEEVRRQLWGGLTDDQKVLAKHASVQANNRLETA